jgi:phosphoribosylamine--glycine ligase
VNVLLVGSGGREHALAWALSASPLVSKLYCAPGNAGIGEVAERVAIDAMDIAGLARFAKEKKIAFAVIGPEAPLVAGITDALEAQGTRTFGPSKKAAMLEGSKGFVKELCAEYRIPTAGFERFRDAKAARNYLSTIPFPTVIKADGLAAGKGVVIAENRKEAEAAIDSMFGGEFGAAGQEILIEEFLEGEEASFFALTDGINVLPLVGAQDHKRAFDEDKGPNTGGMGAYSPAPVLTPDLQRDVISRIVQPTVDAMRARGTPYQGVLYAGLMMTGQGPKLIEYNCRFGDPECQVLVLRLKSDLLPALIAARDGLLDTVDLRWREEVALTVVMATRGYPGSYAKGSAIRGLAEARKVADVEIFHAATELRDGELTAAGGRVLNVSALGRDVREARARAYEAIARIDWPEGFYRSDIGWRAVAREAAR